MAKHRSYRFPLYLFFRGVATLLGILPRRVLLVLALGIAEIGFWLVGRQRNKTFENLRFAFGHEKSEAEIRKIAHGVFRTLALNGADILGFHKLTPEKMRKFIDVQEMLRVYNQLLAEGRGVLSITAHLGHWELLAAAVFMNDIPGGVVGRRIYYEPYNQWIAEIRKSVHTDTLFRENAVRGVLKRLAAGHVIGILPDQDIDSLSGVFVNYFGRPAYTPDSPVRIAMKTGAPMLINYLVRESWDRYRWVNGGVIRPSESPDRSAAAVRRYTEAMAAAFEKEIRRYPEQWMWMHNRWKTQPDQGNMGQETEKAVGRSI